MTTLNSALRTPSSALVNLAEFHRQQARDYRESAAHYRKTLAHVNQEQQPALWFYVATRANQNEIWAAAEEAMAAKA